jgi:hypothetical protein
MRNLQQRFLLLYFQSSRGSNLRPSAGKHISLTAQPNPTPKIHACAVLFQLGSHTMSLKKKGVMSMVQKWQKVKKEVEREERASEQRQAAIRQQLEEWKKENN